MGSYSEGKTNIKLIADVAKLVDALDLGSSAARHGGSSPSTRTLKKTKKVNNGLLY